MIRVLRLREEDPVVWQRALLLSEAAEVSLHSLALLTCLAAEILYSSLCSTLVLSAELMHGTLSADAVEQVHDPC